MHTARILSSFLYLSSSFNAADTLYQTLLKYRKAIIEGWKPLELWVLRVSLSTIHYFSALHACLMLHSSYKNDKRPVLFPFGWNILLLQLVYNLASQHYLVSKPCLFPATNFDLFAHCRTNPCTVGGGV